MQVLLQCRPGFENEAIEEVAERFLNAKGKSTVLEQGDGFILLDALGPRSLYAQLHWKEWCFVRQWWIVHQILAFSVEDRLTLVRESLHTLASQTLGDLTEKPGLLMEWPDTNDGRALTQNLELLAKSLPWDEESDSDTRLAAFFPDKKRCFVGIATDRSAPWPMGIPRLRFPSGAPSRSTLKLAEAFEAFLSPREQELLLAPGQHAVDLGAAPGGWTYQLVIRGMQVQAVDNGPLKGDVASHPAVQHLKIDGFRFRPKRPVDWLVCDMVEQPRRVAELVRDWFLQGWVRHAIFNLKLQPGKRFAEVRMCQTLLLDGLADAGLRGRLLTRQLYHDREEVTLYLRLEGNAHTKTW